MIRLRSQRIPYRRDKTEDEWFFALTLFAIAQEIEARNCYTKEVMRTQLIFDLHGGLPVLKSPIKGFGIDGPTIVLAEKQPVVMIPTAKELLVPVALACTFGNTFMMSSLGSAARDSSETL